MKFCLIRLGKDSVADIQVIDSLIGVQNPKFNFSLRCKQVPHEVTADTLCFIWLGSDNNKGTPTAWNQGLRAFGKILNKAGGPAYNDEWRLNISIEIVFNSSISHHDILLKSSDIYYHFSNIPIIGINTHSNQSVQLIKNNEPSQNVSYLFMAINKIEPLFANYISINYPSLMNESDGQHFLNSQDLDVYLSPPEDEDLVEKDEDLGLQLMAEPFNPSLINIENKLLNIDLFIKRLNQRVPEIDLYPDFQRKDNLWDITKQSRLIESILIRFPLPAFYFDGSNKNKWLVVDGLQRLSSIRNFVIDKTLRLTNLEFLTKLNGHGFDDLDRDLQRVIEETQVVAYIINPGTPIDVKFNIFKRINTGGLVLEPQEIRHALFQGTPAKFVQELASTEEFKIATDYAINPNRMLDRDFANRFIAFYFIDYENYSPDLDSFMNRGMSMIYSLDEVDLIKCMEDFKRSMYTNYSIFGKYAFRKQTELHSKRKPINKALFDVFSVLIAKCSEHQCNNLINNRINLLSDFVDLINNDTIFFSSITSSTSERYKVNYRFSIIEELIFKYSN